MSTPADPQTSTMLDIIGRLASAADASATTSAVLTEFLKHQVAENAQARTVLGKQAEQLRTKGLRSTMTPDQAAIDAMTAALPKADSDAVKSALAGPNPAEALRELRKRIESEGGPEAKVAEAKAVLKAAQAPTIPNLLAECMLWNRGPGLLPAKADVADVAKVAELTGFVDGVCKWLNTVSTAVERPVNVDEEIAAKVSPGGLAIRRMGFIREYVEAVPPTWGKRTPSMPPVADALLRLVGVSAKDNPTETWDTAASIAHQSWPDLEQRAMVHLFTGLLVALGPSIDKAMRNVWPTLSNRQAATATFSEFLRLLLAEHKGPERMVAASLAGTIGQFLQAATGKASGPDAWSDRAKPTPPKAPKPN